MKSLTYKPEMIRAILAGRKTQTRRLLYPYVSKVSAGTKPLPKNVVQYDADAGRLYRKPAMAVGETIYVREAWRTWLDDDGFSPKQIMECYDGVGEDPAVHAQIEYLSDNTISGPKLTMEWNPGRLRPAFFMPQDFSRILQTIKEVRVHRLHDITDADAMAEGMIDRHKFIAPWIWYSKLWDKIHGDGAWLANPMVVAYTSTYSIKPTLRLSDSALKSAGAA